jgi:hypothetical protein
VYLQARELRNAEQRGDRPDPLGGVRVGRDDKDRVDNC